MKTITLFVLFFSYFKQFLCDYESDCILRANETLDGLVVTWAPPNVQNPWAFNHLPRTTKEAEDQNWTKIDDGCKDSSLQHRGQSFALGDDMSVLIIYDKKGYVAGVQRSIPKVVADSGGLVDFAKLEYAYQEHIKGKDRYVFTVYFVDPHIICEGRSESEFETQGTISSVYIKNGPDSYLEPPNNQNEGLLDSQRWTKGLCVRSMGLHYYLHGYKDLNCAEQKPYFVTYDCGRLISVGMFIIGNFTQERRYEFVPEQILNIFIDPIPDCLHELYKPNTYGISAMHMFFDRVPQKIPCP